MDNPNHVLFQLEETKSLNELAQLVRVCLSDKVDDNHLEDLYRKVSLYSERPQLLDGKLRDILDPAIISLNAKDSHVIERAAKVLYYFFKVRNASHVVKLLPHEVEDLKFVSSIISSDLAKDWRWETTYVYLTWLGELVLLPLALERMIENVQGLQEIGKLHLFSRGKPSEASQLLLARLLTRPDVKDLPKFVKWCVSSLNDEEENDVPLLGTLSKILSVGKREDLIQLAACILDIPAPKNALVLRRKVYVKLLRKVALIYLAPRVASWRYQRGNRVLFSSSQKKASSMPNHLDESRVTWTVPVEIDKIMDVLLQGLRDRDTVVRWNSAKGVGRICERIPQDFADEVVEVVMELCSPAEEEYAWHGSCLALAELARRGCLLPSRLAHAMPAVLVALRYDQKQGTRSVGAQVRDAGCYFFWACARAYTADVLKPYSVMISGSLLETAVFDREVNCRRAASAALQEHVGRTGLVTHGLDLVALTDYFRLGSVRTAYLDVGKSICQYPEYGPWMVETLIERKLKHWDPQLRELSAILLGEVIDFPACRDTIVQEMPSIRKGCVDKSDVEVRHGSLLAAAYAGCKCGPDVLDLATIVPELEAGRLFRGKGGEQVRIAACILTRCISERKIPLDLDLKRITPYLNGRPDSGKSGAKRHKEFLDDCLRHGLEDVQLEAGSALTPFCNAYLSGLDPKVKAAIVTAYCKILSANEQEQSPLYTRGAARALGVLPESLFDALSFESSQKCILETIQNSPDAATRKIAVYSIRPNSSVCEEALLTALQDYSTDERGDVGSWAREAACLMLPKLLSQKKNIWSREALDHMVSHLLEIMAGRMDKLKKPARKALSFVLEQESLPLTHRNELKSIFVKDEEEQDVDVDGRVDSLWQSCCLCLSLEQHGRDVFLSYCVSSGLRTPDPEARAILTKFLSQPENKMLACDLWKHAVQMIDSQQGVERTLPHLLCCLDALVRNECFDNAAKQAPQYARAIGVSCWNAFSNTSSISLLYVGVDLMCALLKFDQSLLESILLMLDHRFPLVRQHCSLQLHLQFASVDSLCQDANTRDQLTTLLIEGTTSEASIYDQVVAILGKK